MLHRLLRLIVAAALAGGGCAQGDDAASDTTATTSTSMTTTAAPTTTTVPTTTTTTTVAPTTTAAPSTTTTEAAQIMAEGSGSGDGQAEFSIEKTATVVTLTHDGTGAFVVTDLGVDLEPIGVIVDTTGRYEGTRPLQWETASGGLEITADGDWTYSIYNIDYARHPDCPFDGTGDEVVVVYDFKSANFEAGEDRPVDITFDGDTPFRLWVYGFGPAVQVVETTGPFDDTVAITEGMVIWDITANDGTWTIGCTPN